MINIYIYIYIVDHLVWLSGVLLVGCECNEVFFGNHSFNLISHFVLGERGKVVS